MKSRGFTLIEMLVVMALFLTLMLIVSDIFLTVSLNQRKTLANQRAMNELQYNIEQIIQQARLNKIDYSYYNLPLTGPVQTLALLNDNDERVLIYKQDSGCSYNVSYCIMQKTGKWNAAFMLSAESINIEKLDFYISPRDNPYQFDSWQKKYKSDEQPKITIVVHGKTITQNIADEKVIELQTTVSSRYYER